MLRLPPEEARHATKTLRLRAGDVLELCDGRGWLVRAELAQADRGGAAAHALEAAWRAPRAGWQWDVACACGSLKGGRSDWLVEKCAELGAAALTPLLTERSPVIGGSAADDDRRGQRGGAARRGGASPRSGAHGQHPDCNNAVC
jgi:16S rRNA (uracil1498-N3)-methyltransferase